MQPLLSPEEIATQAPGDILTNRLPADRLFAQRADRLRALAAGHAMADFLLFCARIADIQQTELERLRPLTQRPDEALLLRLLQQHHTLTGSAQAAALLAQWPAVRSRFVKVFPHEYRRALSTQQASTATAQEAALA